jgi:hypothetical protein
MALPMPLAFVIDLVCRVDALFFLLAIDYKSKAKKKR